jgi:AraC-like DNA-binding protein
MSHPPHEDVRMWRPRDHSRLLLMHGTTSAYAVEPDGSYILGLIVRGGLRARRGTERHVLRPGDLCVWDPSREHSGSPYSGDAWEARLMVLELADLEAIVGDPEHAVPDLELRDPRIRDPRLTARFLAVHRAMDRAAWTLERETLLAELLQGLVDRSLLSADQVAARRSARADPAFVGACEFLLDNLVRNVTLDELAAAAGVSRFRVVRLFTAAVAMPPHRFQIAQRVKLARRLLERGAGVSEAAVRTGFFDQSHLHRHFRRSLGTTPREYARRFRKNVQDGRAEQR